MESAGSTGKRVKKPNFTDDETARMLEEISTEAACLLSALENGVTVKKKKEIWERITDKVNAIRRNGRTQDQIKKKWKDLKSSISEYSESPIVYMISPPSSVCDDGSHFVLIFRPRQ